MSGLVWLLFLAAEQTPPPPSGRTPVEPPPKWGGVVFEWIVPVPNARYGTVGGEALSLFNRNSPSQSPLDLSGHRLELSSGPAFVFPAGTSIAGQQHLVVDFSGGAVKFDPRLFPEYQTPVIVAPGFHNDFFENPGNLRAGLSDLLVMLTPDRSRVLEAILYSDGLPLPAGPLVDLAVAQGEWEEGQYIHQGSQDPLDGDVYYRRGFLDAADTDTGRDFGPSSLHWPAPIPGTDHSWYQYNTQTFQWERSYDEAKIHGRVMAPDESRTALVPVAGATVSLPEFGITATSDADGDYTLERVPPGTYAIVARAPGHAPQSRVVEHKTPHHGVIFHFTLQPIVEGRTAVSADLTPAGGVIQGPLVPTAAGLRPAFKIVLYPNPDLPSRVTATWLPATHLPWSIDSQVRKKLVVDHGGGPMELDAYALWEGVGGVAVTPHVPPPPGGGPAGKLWLLQEQATPGSRAGDYVLIEGMDMEGRLEYLPGGAEAFPDGVLMAEGGVDYALSEVPHFSVVTGWRQGTTEDGQVFWYREGPLTGDRDGDGETGLFDSPGLYWCNGGMCPGYENSLTVHWQNTLESTKTGGKTWGGSASGELAIGALSPVTGVISGSGFINWQKSSTTSTATTVGGSFTYTMKYTAEIEPGKPPDKQTKCLVFLWKKIDLKKGLCSYPYQNDIHICSDPFHSSEPDDTVAIPVGTMELAWVDPTEHC